MKERTGFVDLLPQAKPYMQNPNFAGRVEFRFELFQEEIDMNDLADFVLGKSVEYRDKPGKNGTVHTIIEFITKKSAAEFYAFIQEKEPFLTRYSFSPGQFWNPGGGKLSMS